MMVEYVLLLSLLSTLIIGLFTAGNGAFSKTFHGSAPRLGYRIEKLIRTGEDFGEASEKSNWTVKR